MIPTHFSVATLTLVSGMLDLYVYTMLYVVPFLDMCPHVHIKSDACSPVKIIEPY